MKYLFYDFVYIDRHRFIDETSKYTRMALDISISLGRFIPIKFKTVLTASQPVSPGDRVVDQPLESRPVQVPGGEVGQRGGRMLDAAAVVEI